MIKKILKGFKISKIDVLAIVTIIVISLYFKLKNATLLMPFGWDQERDAFVMWEILRDHNFTLIGPRVVGPTGFFLGPYWYYFLAPFYFISNLHPIGATYFLAFLSLLTSATLYVYLKKHSSSKIALLLTLVYASQLDRVVYNPNFILFVCLIFLFISENINNRSKYLVSFLCFWVGLGINLHFILIFLAFPLLFVIKKDFKNHKTLQWKRGIVYLVAFLLPFSPLILFDLRNDFINLKTILGFFTNQNPPVNLASFGERFESVFLNYSAGMGAIVLEVQRQVGLAWGYILGLLAFIGVIYHHEKSITKITLTTCILGPALAFIFYKNTIAQYYFELSWVGILVGIALWLHLLLRKNPAVLALAIFALVGLLNFRYQTLQKIHPINHLYYKEQVAKYIIDNPRGEKNIFVSFKMTPGQDVGFRYLLKLHGNPASDPDPKNVHYSVLYPIDYSTDKPDVIFGEFGVVRRN